MQICRPDGYLGKKVKMTGLIKTKDIKEWAGMWMRVDGPNGVLSFDNMRDRPIRGTTYWEQHSIILDVPNTAKDMAFGILLRGTGEAYIDSVSFEVIGPASNNTNTEHSQLNSKPSNLDFEQ